MSEYYRWLEIIQQDEDPNRFNALIPQLAQIAYRVYLIHAALAGESKAAIDKIAIDDFVLKYTILDPNAPPVIVDEFEEQQKEEQEKKEASDRAKRFFFALVGLDSEGKPRKKEPKQSGARKDSEMRRQMREGSRRDRKSRRISNQPKTQQGAPAPLKSPSGHTIPPAGQSGADSIMRRQMREGFKEKPNV